MRVAGAAWRFCDKAIGARSRLERPGREVLGFFVLAYALSWVAWLPMLWHPDDLQALHYVGSLGPLVAALVFTARRSGRAGLRDLGVRCVRGPARWVLAAVALPLALYAAGWLVSAAGGEVLPLGDFLGSKEYVDVGWTLIGIEIVFFGYGEEVGWRGFALPALELEGRSAHAATTWLAFFWAGWHLPLFFYAHGLATLPWLMVPGWLVSILLSSYLITWFFRSSGDSLLVVALLHGVVDLVTLTPASNAVTVVAVNAGLIGAAVLVTVRTAPSLDERRRRR